MGAKKKAAKPRGKAAPKKSAKKPAAKAKAKAAPKVKAAKTPKLKAPTKAVPKKKRASTAKPVADVELMAGEGEDGDDEGGEKRPGALARLKSGVGSLFARMTGRGKKPDEEPAVIGEAVAPPDVTIDIVTKDIILSEDVPPPPVKRRSKRVTQPDD